jgi:hypothetical protein
MNELNGAWLDFYAMLGVSPDVDKDTLRRKIGETYAEASANCDHRDINRRHYFQTMVERVLPQCRRVLLDPALRARYDEQNRLHQHKDPSALDYVTFMASLQGGTSAAQATQATPSEFDALPERVRDEINLARSVIEAVQSGSEYDFLPSVSVTDAGTTRSTPQAPIPLSSEPSAAAQSAAPTIPEPGAGAASTEYFFQPDQEDSRFREDTTASRPAETDPAPASQQEDDGRATKHVPNDAEPVIRAKVLDLSQEGRTVQELREAAAQAAISDPNSVAVGRPKGAPLSAPKPYKPRVTVEKDPNENPRERRAVLSPVVTHLLTGVVSGALILSILAATAPSGPPARRTPLSVVYSSELKPVMEVAEAQFEASPEGAEVDVVLQAMDSRAAMNAALSASSNAPDVWIPSEAVWSTRYNQVAPKFKKRLISSAGALALSPLVLVARSDRAQPLLKAFPSRKISSWSALQNAVKTKCAGHFGMTTPEESGSGALVRYHMAREWSQRNNVVLGRASAANAGLWRWMAAFENNVPGYKLGGDMVKDLALGTTGQYWWALAYESDAIYWMSQNKKVEVFYLPSTFYADHPFCHLDRAGSTRATGSARTSFERFLRSPEIQQAILSAGFRAPEIDLESLAENNPFQSKAYKARGVQASGFPVGGRLDYRTVNALTSAWSQRYST